MRKRKRPFQSRFRTELFDAKKAVNPSRSTSAFDLILEQQSQRQSMVYYQVPYDEHWEVALSLWGEDIQTAWLFRELDLDTGNPFHWRALLEAFTHTYVTETKDRSSLSANKRLQLARDMDEVRRRYFGGKWQPTRTAKILREEIPYRKRWSKTEFEALRKWIRKVARRLGRWTTGRWSAPSTVQQR